MMKQQTQKEQKQSTEDKIRQMVETDLALQDAMEEAGMEAKTYGIWGPIWKLLKRRDERELRVLSKKKYILFLIFTGWMGGHRFYAGHYYTGALYLMFFWTLIPFMMTVIDLMQIIPVKADENGNIRF